MWPISSKFSKRVAVAAAFGFLIFGFVSQYILPDRFQLDSMAMVDIAEDLAVGGDPSANVIADLIRIFTLPGLTFLIECLAVGAIFYLVSRRKYFLTSALALFSLSVAAPLSLVRPQKENLVFLLTAICVWAIVKCKRERSALFVCLIAYALYTYLSLRPYYLLIVGLIVILSVFSLLSRKAKIALVLALFFAGFFIPATVFELLRLTRDVVNALRVIYPEVEGNRTAFSNPIQEATWWGFLQNYVYAIFRLNFPILFYQTASEIILTVYAGLWFVLMYAAGYSASWRAKVCVRLMMCHLLVLWIFEPDLGSYLRHFSSCVLYLGPILTEIEARWRLSTKRNIPYAGVAIPNAT